MTLRMGVSFIFINQLVFYHLLSKASTESKKMDKYPEIAITDYDSPLKIHENYFEKVREHDYEPIYGFNVAKCFSGNKGGLACKSVISAIRALESNLDNPDVVGQIFQTLIPLSIRKPLGAHYTNPNAAQVLAHLSIQKCHDTVIDPACGSGTLLVSSYERKASMLGKKVTASTHKQFLEKEITGIDVMAFSAHLAAVNLALRHPLEETDFVRIATTDSTLLRPGIELVTTRDTLSSERKQSSLFHDFKKSKVISKKTAVLTTKAGKINSFTIDAVDVVLMNPPFTSWDNMGKSYRDNLNLNFSNRRNQFRQILYWKISQQAHFLLLADELLKPNGIVGAVLPITTFTGEAFGKLVDFIVNNYTVNYIFIGLGRMSYSEDTSLAECLFVGEKKTPPANHQFTLIGTLNSPDRWTPEEISAIIKSAETHKNKKGITVVKKFKQTELLLNNTTLSGMILRMDKDFDDVSKSIHQIEASNKLVTIEKHLSNNKQDINRWILGSEHLDYYGHTALVALDSEIRALKEGDRLIFSRETSNQVILRDRIGNAEYAIPKTAISPALRRFSYLTTIGVANGVDYCLSKPSQGMVDTLEAFYGKKDATKLLNRIQETSAKYKGGRWHSRVVAGSSRLCFARRLDLAAPGSSVNAIFSEAPMFLLGDGFFLKGSTNTAYEKLLCMWVNSSYSLFKMMEKMTITRGTWMKFEKSNILRIPIIDFSRINKQDWKDIELAFDNAKAANWPSFKEQLDGLGTGRIIIDDLILKLLGIKSKKKRVEIIAGLHAALLNAIVKLEKSMKSK